MVGVVLCWFERSPRNPGFDSLVKTYHKTLNIGIRSFSAFNVQHEKDSVQIKPTNQIFVVGFWVRQLLTELLYFLVIRHALI